MCSSCSNNKSIKNAWWSYKESLKNENIDALKKGLPNLERHIQNIKKFGLEVVVAINHFISDTDKEVKIIQDYVQNLVLK